MIGIGGKGLETIFSPHRSASSPSATTFVDENFRVKSGERIFRFETDPRTDREILVAEFILFENTDRRSSSLECFSRLFDPLDDITIE
jgi:hypothetical protein